MPTDDHLSQQDRDRHRNAAAAFWGVSLLLTVALLVAFPPTKALGSVAGISIAVVAGLVTIVYIGRLRGVGERTGDRELFIASAFAATVLAIDQWLAGGFQAPFYLLLTLHVLGSAAVLPPRLRVGHLAIVSAVVAAPLFYDGVTFQRAATVVVFIGVLAMEALLLADFGERLRAQRRALIAAEQEASNRALTDTLTGLGNRRALAERLQEAAGHTDIERPLTMVYLDLDGFKLYNDRFGHPAGDALLERLGRALGASVDGRGRAFRVGGDEFCVLLDHTAAREPNVVDEVAAALTESGPGFNIKPSCGIVVMPEDAADSESALRLADERMYAAKRSGRPSPAQEISELLLRALAEREPGLLGSAVDVRELACEVASDLGLSGDELDTVGPAAELRDIGKLAMPDTMLVKPGPLEEREWGLMQQHTLIGERILASSTSMVAASKVVRSSHERWDGSGYPDGLAGEEIPLAARVVAVCDAYAEMLAESPYRPAMDERQAAEELRRCAGTQFDPAVVEALVVARQRSQALTPA